MPLSTPEARRLVDAQAAARDRTLMATQRRVEALVASFDQWWDDAAVAALAQRISTVVGAGQLATSRATDAYLARVIGQALGRPIPPVGVRVTPDQWRRANPVDVYGRPAADVRRRVASGATVEAAIGMALTRYQSMAATDLALAMTNTSRGVFQSRGRYIDGYRRIIHPEFTRSGGTCGLCVAASDRVYDPDDLMPLHDNCRCETLPIVDGQDPGRDLSEQELQALYDDAGGTAAAKLKRTRYQVNEHGELGPVLREQGHHFRGPAEVAAA